MKEKPIPYLETGLVEQRMKRLMSEELNTDLTQSKDLGEEKGRIVPRSSLELNMGRSQL